MAHFRLIVVRLLAAATVGAGAVGITHGQAHREASTPNSGIVTLYAHDPEAQTFCLRDASYGMVLQKGEQRNRCSDVAFNIYAEGSLSVAVEGGVRGSIVDLGTDRDLEAAYGFADGLTKTAGYVSLGYEAGKVVLAGRADVNDRSRVPPKQELKEAEQLFTTAETVVSAAITPGHIYLVRLVFDGQADKSLLAKILVLSYRPNEEVTLRWDLLSVEHRAAP